MADEATTGQAAGSTANAGTTGDAGQQQQEKVTFTKEQQSAIQVIVDDAYTRAFEKAEKQTNDTVSALKTEVAELTKLTQKDDGNAQSDKGKASAEDYENKIAEINEKHQTDLESAQGKNKAILDRILKSDIINAAAKADCTAPDELAEVLVAQGQVTLNDEGGYDIDPPDGITKIGDDGKPISLSLFIDRFIAANPHWKKFTGKPGTGSKDGDAEGGGKILKDMSRKEIMALPRDEFQKLDAEQNLKHTKGWLEED